MPDKTYRINLRSGDINIQFQEAIQDIFARRTAESVAARVAKVIDREVSKVFYYTAIDIFQNSFGDIAPYTGTWRQYSKKYSVRKLHAAGHLDWFKFGEYGSTGKGKTSATYARQGEKQLGDELFGISQQDVLDDVGQTQVSISRDKKTIRVSVAPRLRFSKANMERQFTDLLNERTIAKLQNRKRAYRALIGPEFMFMLNQRIPDAVDASLARV